MDQDLQRIDTALIALRHLWSVPPAVEHPGLGRVDMSTIWIVEALARAEAPMTVRSLAQALDVAHSTASRLVDRAQGCGAVQRGQASGDARSVAVALTPAGSQLRQAAVAHRAAFLQYATGSWTPAQRADFAVLLTEFAAAVANPPTQQEETP